ncbi:hypothetical protein X777_14350 [Ooceraea biroi]|uniref:Uncharacterized protein n=1 Tax=Ooceraea biroi TaxID=2015173 RepID=A0A026WUY8_OOCBI|nr:hypothetical protein X777_14350 [Ooceraea biroi]
MAPGVAFALSLILVVGHLQDGPGSLAKSFTFPEYPYKETTKNELLFRQFEQACEESGACKLLSQHRSGGLEEGEIDVRLNSFKGCFMQRNARPRK